VRASVTRQPSALLPGDPRAAGYLHVRLPGCPAIETRAEPLAHMAAALRPLGTSAEYALPERCDT